MKNLLLIALSAVVVFACGANDKGGRGGVPGSELPALTDAQKISVRTISLSYNDIDAMVREEETEQPKQANTSAMKGKLEKAVNEKRCEQSSQKSEKALNDTETEKNTEILITGDQCPIQYEYAEVRKRLQVGEDGTMKENYSAHPELEIYSDTDVISYNLTGQGKSRVIGQSGNSVTIKYNTDYVGSLQSKSYGKVGVALKATGTEKRENPKSENPIRSGRQYTVIDYTFTDFRVMGFTDGPIENEKATKFYVNGEQTTREEFAKLFGQERRLNR